MPQASKRRSSHPTERTAPAPIPAPAPAPAQGWLDGDVDGSAYPSYTAPAIPHLQYGPLTAQDDYLSNINWPEAPAGAAGALEGLHAGQQYAFDINDNQLVSDSWLTAGGDPALQPSGGFEIYGPVTEPQYQTHELAHGSSVDVEVPALSDFSAAVVPHNVYSPYDGIWAYNPLAVDDNFVYPTTIPSASTGKANMSHDLPSSAAITSNSEASTTASDLAASYAATAGIASDAFPASVPVALRPQLEKLSTTESAGMAPKHAPMKSSKPERAKRNRAAQSQVSVPRRQGPLSTAQRQKADDMRYYGACWRCRRYKKPCNGPGTCDTCLTSGFRVWPSTIGCYRGNMEDFISGVMPGNAEQVIDDMTFGFNKVPNWKTLFGFRPDMAPIPLNAKTKDKYDALSIKLQATRMAGAGFIELLEILANYQRSQTKPDTCLELACSALNHICDIYHAFVETDTPVNLNATELLNALTKFRTAYNDNWRHFLQLCLSGRRSAWFPAFLCACINVPLLVVLKDGFTAIPEPARSTLWPNITFLIEDLRNRLYPMGLDLLGALAKGIKPWKLHCWGWKETVEADGTITVQRDPDGMRLLAGDTGAFDGFAAVQQWLSRNRMHMLDGVSFLTTPPFSERNAKMQPIAALAWIFDVNPPKERGIANEGGQIIV